MWDVRCEIWGVGYEIWGVGYGVWDVGHVICDIGYGAGIVLSHISRLISHIAESHIPHRGDYGAGKVLSHISHLKSHILYRYFLVANIRLAVSTWKWKPIPKGRGFTSAPALYTPARSAW